MGRLWEYRGSYCRGAYVGRPPVYKGIPLSTIYVSGLATCEPLQQKDLSSCDKSFFHIGPFAVQEVARAPRFVL